MNSPPLKSTKKKRLIAALVMTFSAAHTVSFSQVVDDAYQGERESTRRLISSRDLNDQATRQQAQARAVSLAASTQKGGTLEDPGKSEAVQQEIERQKNLVSSALAAASPGLIDNIRAKLPKVSQVAGQLKYGEHIVVSKEGREIVDLIRSLAGNSPGSNAEALKKLQNFAAQDKPEAVNFLGFSYEFGLFGLPKNISKAMRYYQAAASENYASAIYNLALVAAYGKAGRADQSSAVAWATRAHQAAGNDASGRICGLASYLTFRAGNLADSKNFALGCNSPLAHLAKATTDNSAPITQRTEWLRDSIATGADEGYGVIVQISRPLIKTDNSFTFCKYSLINRYRQSSNSESLREDATRCVDQTLSSMSAMQKAPLVRDQILSGVISFVPTEIKTLENMRKSNRAHYSWAVPYLPFAQSEVDLFEPMLLRATVK